LGVDPCAPTRGPGNVLVPASASLTECQHTGVTAAQYGNGGTTNGIPQCVSNQCGQVIGGNPDLTPERADTYSIGATLTPGAMPDFTASIDYYSISLKDSVGAIPGAFLFQQCLASGNPTYCSQVVRSSLGALTGSSVGSGGYILQTAVNIGAAKLSGIDVQGSYKWTMPEGWGSLLATLNGASLLKTTSTPLPGAHTYDCAGLFGTTCQTLNPKWRHNLRVSWDTSWKTLISLQWRYISKVKLDNNDSDPSLFGAEFDGEINNFNGTLGAANYFDLSALYTFRPGLQVRAGVNNLFDRNPQSVATELSGTGGPNTYPTYDILGRQAFLGVTAQF
jgi:outer membrane receptor protein involved in Fe transport